MIGIKQFRWSLALPRIAQPHRYAPVQFPTTTSCSKGEVC
jgi:hypothetical protein